MPTVAYRTRGVSQAVGRDTKMGHNLFYSHVLVISCVPGTKSTVATVVFQFTFEGICFVFLNFCFYLSNKLQKEFLATLFHLKPQSHFRIIIQTLIELLLLVQCFLSDSTISLLEE